MANNLNVASNFMVVPGLVGVELRNGHAYVVRSDSGLVIGTDGQLARPGNSGETFLASLAVRYGAQAIAVALTELNAAEIAGFHTLKAAGGHTVALDEADRLWADSSGPRVVPDAADELLTTSAIGPRLLAIAAAPAHAA